MIQFTFHSKMTTQQIVETSVTVNNTSRIPAGLCSPLSDHIPLQYICDCFPFNSRLSYFTVFVSRSLIRLSLNIIELHMFRYVRLFWLSITMGQKKDFVVKPLPFRFCPPSSYLSSLQLLLFCRILKIKRDNKRNKIINKCHNSDINKYPLFILCSTRIMPFWTFDYEKQIKSWSVRGRGF